MAADLQDMAAFAKWVENITGELDLSPSAAFAVQLCLEELVANVILHAVPLAARKLSVTISFVPAGKNLRVTVEDDGAPFDPTAAAIPSAKPDLNTTGGRGLMLIRHFAQALTYSRAGDRNRTMLDFTNDDYTSPAPDRPPNTPNAHVTTATATTTQR